MSYATDLREPDLEDLEAERAWEFEFRLDHDLISDDAWNAYLDAYAEWWAQVDDAPIPKDRSDDVLAERRAARMERESELRAMPYDEYLQTPEWRRRASAAIARAGGRCQVCFFGSQLVAHHRTYERRGVEHDDDLVALCKRCHSLFHETRRLARWGPSRPRPSS